MKFYYSNDPNRPAMPLGTKLAIWGFLLLGLVLLIVFGFTFFLIALAGGVLTFLANLLGIGRGKMQSPVTTYTTYTYKTRDRSSSQSSRKYRDDDDVIDV